MQNLNFIEMVSEIKTIGDAANDVVVKYKTLGQSVTAVLQNYFLALEGQAPTDLYQLVLNEVEPALLEKVLIVTRGNETKAAKLLGLSRGTLRKKLKLHGLKK